MKSGTVAKSREEQKTRRCAVFKIDLNGRFVYVDEKTEKLLKVPSESIFGQSVSSYLDKASADTVREILNYGRLYETFYEYAILNFIDSAQAIHTRNVIISLNFIGGNPANFQVVIAPEDTSERISAEETTQSGWESRLYKWLAEMEGGSDWDGLMDIILDEDGPVQAAVYLVRNNNPEFLSGKSRPDYSEKGYDLTIIDDNLKQAVEYNKPCLNVGRDRFDGLTDTVYPLACRNRIWGLLRIVFDSQFENLPDRIISAAGFLGNGLAGYFAFEEGSRNDGPAN